MPSPLTAAGAISEPSEYATLSMDRAITGLWTQRSPLRDADVPYLYGKFYSASRFDSLFDGINREVTANLTYRRRPGSSIWNANTFPAINSFFEFKYIQNSAEIIRIIADGQDGNIYDCTAGTQTTLFTKSSGATKARFLGVNTRLFFTDGVENKNYVQSSYVWSADEALPVGAFIVDNNLNIQMVTATTAQVTSVTVASGICTCQVTGDMPFTAGQSITFLTAVSAGFLSLQTFTIQSVGSGTFSFPVGVSSYGPTADNVQAYSSTGTADTGTSYPAFSSVIGGITNEGNLGWTCKGSAIQNWGIVAPTTAPTVTNAAIPPSTVGWAANTFYLLDDYLLDSHGNLQFLYTPGTTGTSVPTWSTTAGALTTDGTCKWLCLGTATRANSHQYYGAISTTLVNAITGTGSQTATPTSLNNIYVGKVLIIDSGASQEPVVVTAINASSGTFTATFANTHASAATVVGSPDTIGLVYSQRIRVVVDYIGSKPIWGWDYVYFSDFFTCTTNGKSNSAAPQFQPGAGTTTNDGTAVWTNLSPELVWTAPAFNPDGTKTQVALNPSGTAAVLVSNAQQIVDSNGYLQNVHTTGLSGATAPTWSTTLGGLTADHTSSALTWVNAGISPTTAGTSPWLYSYSYKNSVTNDVSTSAPVSIPITLNSNSVIIVQGMGSSDPQVDTIEIYRTAQGQSTLLLLDSIANPGAGLTWTYSDPGTPDTNLNAEISAPIALQNSPPPIGMTAPCYHLQRIWGIVGNTVVYSAGPDEVVDGNGNTAFPPLNVIPFEEQPIRLMPITVNNGGLLVFTTTNVYVILGIGTASNPFYPTNYMLGVGILSYDALDMVGSTLYLMTSKSKFVSLDPSAGYVEAGFPIGDQFTNVTTGAGSAPTGKLYSPSSTYVTWHEQSSGDTAIYVADGSVGWFRFSPVASPESGYLWSPRAAILQGTSAVQSIEVSPGITQLLIGPPAGGGPILFRDTTVNWDYNGIVHGLEQWSAYPSWDVKGNIVLCQSGEVAEIAHIAVKSMALGSRPIVSLLLGEIQPTVQVPWEALSITSCDPPELEPSQTLYSDRYSALQNGVCPKCDHFQLKIDYGLQSVPDELLMFSVYGAKHAERKQQ